MKTHRCYSVALTIVVLAGTAFAQAPPATLNAVYPPTVSTQPNYTDFNSYVIPNPTVNGVTVGLPWSAVDKSTKTGSTSNYDFTTWDTNNLAQFENTNKVVNLIVLPVLESNVNSYTPSYVFSQEWANGTVPWESALPGWTATTKYLPDTYILVSGHYQQEINTVTPTSGFDGHCVSGSSQPTFSTTGGTVTDGTAPTQCAWQDIGTHGPLQAMAACPSYAGAISWVASNGFPNGKIVVPTNAVGGQPYNLHFYQQNSGSSCTSAATEPTWPTNGGTVTDNTCTWLDNQGATPWTASTGYAVGKVIVPESSAYNLHFYKQSAASSCTSSATAPTTWNITGDSFTDNNCTWLDTGSVIPANTGMPVSYNLPFLTAYQKFAAAVYDHYANHAPTGLKVGYIRFGMSDGGEASPLCNSAGTQSSGWPKYSKYTYLAYVSDMTTYFGGLITTVPQVADMHAVGSTPDYDYADQEALYANNNSIGLDTNGLSVNDVTQIQNGNCTTKGSTLGDWCKNFNTYCGKAMPSGKYPICSLQTLTASTPGTDTSGNTGSLSVDGTFPGLIPTAQAHGATNLEIYTIDTLLAVSPNYCTDTGGHCGTPDYSGYQGPYEAAFETFLGETPGVYSPTPGTTLPTGTVTFSWDPKPGAYPCTLASVSYALRAGQAVGGTSYFSVTGLSGSTLSYAHTISATSGSTVYVRWGYTIASTCGGGGTTGHVDYTYTAP
ncbi:MAG TPA: hypothetical protein VNX26_18680 [Candidatus Acidoferrum sp.]|nr:hypothetical protein [Candidatus Acidoferrum sp.]